MKKIIAVTVYRMFGVVLHKSEPIKPCGYTTTQKPTTPPFNEWMSHIYNNLNKSK